jgi:predicted secreted protein
LLQAALLAGTSVTMIVLNDGTNGWTGDFMISSMEMGAAVAGAVTNSIALESTGAVTKTP